MSFLEWLESRSGKLDMTLGHVTYCHLTIILNSIYKVMEEKVYNLSRHCRRHGQSMGYVMSKFGKTYRADLDAWVYGKKVLKGKDEYGRPAVGKQWYSIPKLTDENVIFCRENLGKFSRQELADMFFVTLSKINMCLSGETHSHLNGRAKPNRAHFRTNLDGSDKKSPGAKPKLTDEQVIQARSLIKTKSLKTLAEEFGVSYQTMYNAIKGLTYKHLNSQHKPQE